MGFSSSGWHCIWFDLIWFDLIWLDLIDIIPLLLISRHALSLLLTTLVRYIACIPSLSTPFLPLIIPRDICFPLKWDLWVRTFQICEIQFQKAFAMEEIHSDLTMVCFKVRCRDLMHRRCFEWMFSAYQFLQKEIVEIPLQQESACWPVDFGFSFQWSVGQMN